MPPAGGTGVETGSACADRERVETARYRPLLAFMRVFYYFFTPEKLRKTPVSACFRNFVFCLLKKACFYNKIA